MRRVRLAEWVQTRVSNSWGVVTGSAARGVVAVLWSLPFAIASLLGATSATAQAPDPSCLTEDQRGTALRVGLLTLAPAPLCAPSYQVVEIRNDASASLGDARLFVAAPLGAEAMSFAPLPGGEAGAPPRYIEASGDDGATWTPIANPLGSGAPGDPFVFSSAQIAGLARLGPSGGSDDSVLVRWRARLGEAFGSPLESEARLELSATARDACQTVARAPLRASPLSVRRPLLFPSLEGRNATRGGAFSDAVAAAPGDRIEWRASVDNPGDALAVVARVALTLDGAPLTLDVPAADDADVGAAQTRAASLAVDGVLSFDGVVPGGRRSVLFETRAPDSDDDRAAPPAERRFGASVSWGCATPPPGRPAALTPLAGGSTAARLLLQPDPNLIGLEQRMTGADGDERPGDRATVRLSLRNDGPPALDPELEIRLPDGYVADRRRPVTLFASGADASGVDLAEGGEAGAARLKLTAGPGRRPALNQGDLAQIALPVRRVRAGVVSNDFLSTRVVFKSGYGQDFRTRAYRLAVSPRQPALTAALEPIEPPLISGPAQTRRFRVRIGNKGEAAAARLVARMTFGSGWGSVADAPDFCRPAPDPAAETPALLCRLPEASAPGERVSFEVAVTSGPRAVAPPPSQYGRNGALSASDEAEGQGGPADLRVSLQVDAFAESADVAQGWSAPSGDAVEPLATVAAASSGVGFVLEQRLLGPDGREWPGTDALTLGDPVDVVISARWFGVAADTVTDVALFQTLPEGLALSGAPRRLAGAAARAALKTDQNQVFWTLPDLKGGGFFRGRAPAVAIDLDASAAPADAFAGPPSTSSDDGPPVELAILANAVFGVGGVDYGVEGNLDGPTTASPLVRALRIPDLRLGVRMDRDGTEVGTPDADEAVEVLRAGERFVAHIQLTNAGRGPAFVDWVRLRSPPGVSVAPFLTDGLDNDGDGDVDEPDEDRLIGKGDPPTIRAGSEIQWRFAPATAGRRGPPELGRLAAGQTLSWPVLIVVDPEAAAGAAYPVDLEAQFGARPRGGADEVARGRVAATAAYRTEPVQGVLVLTQKRGAPLSDDGPQNQVSHGGRLEHRMIVRLPPGRYPDAVLALITPPALANATPGLLRVGAGVDCVNLAPGAAPPVDRIAAWEAAARAVDDGADGGAASAGDEAGRPALVWRLGACDVALDAPEAARTLLVDVQSTVSDAPADAASEARAAWRAPRLTAWFRGRSPSETGADDAPAPRIALIGRSAMTVGGALLRWERLSAPTADLDAGDVFEATLRLSNVGDAPASKLRVSADRAARRACLALSLSTGSAAKDPPAAAPIETSDAPVVGDTAMLGPPQPSAACPGAELGLARLAAGDSVLVQVSGRLPADLEMGREVIIPLSAAAASGLGDPAPSARAALLRLPLGLRGAPPPATEATVGLGGRGAAAGVALGAPVLFESVHPLPEGSGDVTVALRVRLTGSDRGAALDERPPPPLRLTQAALAREPAALRFEDDPAGLDAAGADVAVEAASLVSVRDEPGGWRRFEARLGDVRRDEAVDGPRDGRVVLNAVMVLEEAPALGRGVALEAQAFTLVRDADGATVLEAEGPPAPPVSVVEPALSLAALHDADGGSVGVGDAVRFFAEICNRGGAPAFDIAVAGALPPGFVFDPSAPPQFLAGAAADVGRRVTQAPLFGVVARGGDGAPTALTARSADGAPLAPGACATVVTPSLVPSAASNVNPAASAAELTGGGAPGRNARSPAVANGALVGDLAGGAPPEADGDVAALFRIDGFRSRPKGVSSARDYPGGPWRRALLRLKRLSVDTPTEIGASPGDQVVVPLVIRALGETEGFGLSVALTHEGPLRWRLWRDANGDSALDAGDPPWRDGEVLPPGGAVRLLADARIPDVLPEGWRAATSARVVGVATSGRTLLGLSEFAILPEADRGGTVAVTRSMAVDRDCDGLLDDETAQDAAFETLKEAALGECVVMRLAFQNDSGVAVEGVFVEDVAPAGVRYLPGSARFEETPEGLVRGALIEPRSAGASDSSVGAAIRFGFVGALSPKKGGAVSYRVRLAPR